MVEREREERIVAAARALVGVRFRLHGRCPASGMDCVGLVAAALEGGGLAGVRAAAPCGYRLRGGRVEDHVAALRAAGLIPVDDERPGDVLLVRAGVAQFHLMVATGIGDGVGYVHAHAGLGRVVEMPGRSPWPVLGRWRVGLQAASAMADATGSEE